MSFQTSLFAAARTEPSFELLSRCDLGEGAWVDVCPGWLPDADAAFEVLRDRAPWRSERRQMYDRTVDVPRLIAHYGRGEQLPHSGLEVARAGLEDRYGHLIDGTFASAGCCYYRDGRDSVAWHGDRIGRGRNHDTVIAIVSLGAPRRLALRPRSGGASASYVMGHGDLLVMGGTCQRTFDHCVPKVSSAGPRISVQFRPRNVY